MFLNFVACCVRSIPSVSKSIVRWCYLIVLSLVYEGAVLWETWDERKIKTEPFYILRTPASFRIYSAHVLLNLLTSWGMDKMRGLPSILSLFRNEFYKLNNTDKTDTRF